MQDSDMSFYGQGGHPGQVTHTSEIENLYQQVNFLPQSLTHCSISRGNWDHSQCKATGRLTAPTKPSYFVTPGSAQLSALNQLCTFRFTTLPPWIIMYKVWSRAYLIHYKGPATCTFPKSKVLLKCHHSHTLCSTPSKYRQSLSSRNVNLTL